MLGDGFLQHFLHENDCQASIPCKINDLIPGTQSVPTFMSGKSKLPKVPLWQPERWPKTVEFLSEHPDFMSLLGSQTINDRNDCVGFLTRSVQYEYRAYLWHYFKWVEYRISTSKIKKSSWKEIIGEMATFCRPEYVTFNYDSHLKWIISSLRGEIHYPDFRNLATYYGSLPTRRSVVVHVHGGIDRGYDYPEFLPSVDDDFWKFDVQVAMTSASPGVLERSISPSARPPTLPTIIPPGCCGDNVCLTGIESARNAKYLLSSTSAVVCVGLSGRHPDTREVQSLLDVISEKALFVQVGLEADRNGDAPVSVWRRERAESGKPAKFLPSEEISKIPRMIAEHFHVPSRQ